MERVKGALRSLTQEICRQLRGFEIPKKPVWTVDLVPATHVALDIERPAWDDLRYGLSVGLFRRPEYEAVAEAIETDPICGEGIVIDAGGFLQKPERTNVTRALVTNFLWRYLGEGAKLDWNEARFLETFDDLTLELQRKSVVFHTVLPLSNRKMEVASVDFDDGLRLRPASVEELERLINRDRIPVLGAGPPQWDSAYVDKPGVLHARQVVIGRPPPKGGEEAKVVLDQLPRVKSASVITALRLVLNVPISGIFAESHIEGLMAFGGRGTSWGWSAPPLRSLVTLDEEKATQVVRIWRLLNESPNRDLLGLPIRRWESSLLRMNPEDRLIDAWISLEALLIADGNAELAHRAALRLAELLGKDGPGRQAIYGAALNSYGWRSKIVHGSRSKKTTKQEELVELARQTSEYVRAALLKVLELGDLFVARKLDSNLLGREASRL